MSNTLERAKRRYAKSMVDAGQRWKKGVRGKRKKYRKEIGKLAGVKSGSVMADNWQEGVDGISAKDFNLAVKGKAELWANRFAKAVAR